MTDKRDLVQLERGVEEALRNFVGAKANGSEPPRTSRKPASRDGHSTS
jgi:hypothetical protein